MCPVISYNLQSLQLHFKIISSTCLKCTHVLKFFNPLVILVSYLLWRVFALESVLLGGGKRIIGCSSKTCNEPVRGDLGIDTLQAKLKWW